MGWNGIKNGELLKVMIAHKFDALLTFDKNLQHQQNFVKYPLAVIVLNARSNTYPVLTMLSSQVNGLLTGATLPGGPAIVSQPRDADQP